MVVIFISSAPLNSATYHLVTQDFIANHHVMVVISLIVYLIYNEQLQGER